MTGSGLILWIPIGASSGWLVSRLMVSADDDALRGTAAGMIGAVLAGLGAGLVYGPDAAGRAGQTMLFMSLAGALWMTWITCVLTAGRRPRVDSAGLAPRNVTPDGATHVSDGRTPMTYATAREELVDGLLTDAIAHDAGRFGAIGRHFRAVEDRIPHGAAPQVGKLHVALAFWDGWMDARDHDWRTNVGIAQSEWPTLARSVAADLEGDRDVSDMRVVRRFDMTAHPSPATRVQDLAARLRIG
jgi:hypothetical protein